MLKFLKVSHVKLERRQPDLGTLQTALIHLTKLSCQASAGPW